MSRRRVRRRAANEPGVSFLNIVPMLDVVTIILVFLLKSIGESSASVPQSDDLRLPASIVRGPAAEDGLVVTVSKTQILVGDQRVLTLPSRASMVRTGAGAANKRDPQALYIVPLGAAIEAAETTDRAVRMAKRLDPNASEAILIADASTPYRLLSEVMFTLGQRSVGKFHLVVVKS
jgi:biopolymer transport protein ExbD